MYRIFSFWWFPLIPQLITLTVFILLIVDGFAANTEDMEFAKVLRNTNLANLIVWSYWWPLIILSSIFFGRVWCMICPMELLTTFAARIGLKRKPPGFVRSGWVITLLYIIILFGGIHIYSIHRVPFRMSIYLMAILTSAVIVGLLFSRNTFCANVCPVGHLLGLYSRLAPFGWSVRNRQLCQDCNDNSCTTKANAYLFQGRSCGVGLYPASIDDNTDCLLCGQCLKACDQNNPATEWPPNPGWFARPWFKDVLILKPMSVAQASFCLILSGFVIYEVFTEWKVTKELLLWTPHEISMWFKADDAWFQGLIKSLILFVILPMLFWMLPYGLLSMRDRKLSFRKFICTIGTAFIPIMAAAHIVKALLKTTSRIPYWKHAFTDPVGINTAKEILNKSLQLLPLPSWRDPVVTVVSLVLVAIGIVVSVFIIRKFTVTHAHDTKRCTWPLYIIPGLYGGAFTVMLCLWRLF